MGRGQTFLNASCFRGRPTGAAMPLVWAHAEHLKLVRSLHDGRVFDMPVQTWQRYVIEHTRSRHACWRFNHRLQRMDPGRTLRLETLVPCLVHWSADGWRTVHDTLSRDPGLGEHVVDLPTEGLPTGTTIAFTFYWSEVKRWEQVDFQVVIASTVACQVSRCQPDRVTQETAQAIREGRLGGSSNTHVASRPISPDWACRRRPRGRSQRSSRQRRRCAHLACGELVHRVLHLERGVRPHVDVLRDRPIPFEMQGDRMPTRRRVQPLEHAVEIARHVPA